jgi:hypothetical protein
MVLVAIPLRKCYNYLTSRSATITTTTYHSKITHCDRVSVPVTERCSPAKEVYHVILLIGIGGIMPTSTMLTETYMATQSGPITIVTLQALDPH